MALGVSNFVYFYTFHGLKHLWPADLQDAKKDSLFAYIAGVFIFLCFLCLNDETWTLCF